MAFYSLIGPKQQWVDANGNPLSGYKLFTYAAGTSTKKTTYTDDTGSVANANPIVLNSSGQASSGVYGSTGAYKLVMALPTDTDPPLSPIWTQDGVQGINDTASVTLDEWINSGFTPTYISATSFSVPGDQTAVLNIGRRLKTSNSGGTIYSTISNSVFGASITTVTVVNDSGTLDSGISAVYYGILSASNPSAPTIRGLPIGFPDAATDFVAFFDSSGSIMARSLAYRFSNRTVLAGPVSTTSGSTINLVASGLKAIPYNELEIHINGVSMSNTEDMLIQLADDTGFITSGYTSRGSIVVDAAATASRFSSSGFIVCIGAAAATVFGVLILKRRENYAIPGGDSWAITGNLTISSTGGTVQVSGTMDLSSATPVKTLDGIRITRSGGAATFDAGAITVYGRI